MPRRVRRSPWTNRTEQVVSHPPKSRRLLVAALGPAGALLVLLGVRFLLGSGTDAPRPPVPAQQRQTDEAVAVAHQKPPAPAAQATQAALVPELHREKPTPSDQARKLAEQQARSQQPPQPVAWPAADSAQPDQDVVSLDPSLLPDREPELRRHLETNALDESQMDNVRDIVEQASEARTRYAAIQALGRAHGERAQGMLMELFDTQADIVDKRMLLGYVRPDGLNEPSVEWLVNKLRAPELAPELKKQATFSLVLAMMAEQRTNPNADLNTLLARVPQEWQQEMLDTYRTLTRP